MLVVISNPDDLPDWQRLDTEAERQNILIATEKLQRERRLDVTFLDDASLGSIQDALLDGDFHILHFSGHGDVDPDTGQGVLLLENEEGRTELVNGSDFANIIRNSGLRFVLLSACKTAAPAHHQAWLDIGSQIAVVGVAANVAMQYPVEDSVATQFAEKLYRSICTGNNLHTAIARARTAIAEGKSQSAAFATPVAYVFAPNCLQIAHGAVVSMPRQTGIADFGLVPRMGRGFVGRSRQLRRLRRNLTSHQWIAAVIHGIGGIGKSALATRLASRLLDIGVVEGVKVINCTPSLTADQVLLDLNAFLNLLGETCLNKVIHEPVSLQTKNAVLAQALNAHRVLVIFDNVEDCLKLGSLVSRAEERVKSHTYQDSPENTTAFRDMYLGQQVAQLVGSVNQGSTFLFTSRIAFDFVEPGRMTDAIGSVGLEELSFTMAVQLMNRHEILADLPIDSQDATLSKRWIYEHLGGHPWAINQFAIQVKNSTPQEARRVIEEIRHDLLTFTLVQNAIEAQSERGRQILIRASIYDQPVPIEGLAFLLGDKHDCMPDISLETESLLKWGLLTYERIEGVYVLPVLVRDWGREQLTQEMCNTLYLYAADYWLGIERDTDSIFAELCAHDYLLAAGEYERAYDLIDVTSTYLRRWGYVELTLRLLSESVQTLTGLKLGRALHNLAIVYQELADYDSAEKYYKKSLDVKRQLSDQKGIALGLNQLGVLNFLRGDYEHARDYYELALAAKREIGDRCSLAKTLHNLGNLCFQLEDYEGARSYHEEALKIFTEESADEVDIASIQLGFAHLDYHYGNYADARQHCDLALSYFRKLGDKSYIAACLHQLGLLDEQQGELEKASACYEEALQLSQQIGSRAGVVHMLYGLASIHRAQGNLNHARERYEQALAINRDIGDKEGVASSQFQLGDLCFSQNELEHSQEHYMEALSAYQELDDKSNIAQCLLWLGIVCSPRLDSQHALSHLERAFAIFESLGDMNGIAQSLFHQGMLHYRQSQYQSAHDCYTRALVICKERNDTRNSAKCLYQLGQVFYSLGDLAGAIQQHEEALALEEELGDISAVAESLFQLGMLHQRKGEYAQAARRYDEAVEKFQGWQDKTGIAKTKHQMGMLLVDQGKSAAAIDLTRQALTIFRDLNDKYGMASSLLEYGNEHLLQGQYKDARKYYEESIAIDRELSDKVILAKALGQLGILLELQDFLTEAIQAQAESYALFTELNVQERVSAWQRLLLLRERVGIDEFTEAIRKSDVDIPSDIEHINMTHEQTVFYVVSTTINVLSSTRDMSCLWHNDLGQIREQIQQSGDITFVTFLTLTQQLVDGDLPNTLTDQVPADYRSAWDVMVCALPKG